MSLTRRMWLGALAGGLISSVPSLTQAASLSSETDCMPGPFRGRVIGVEDPGALWSGAYSKDNVREMMRRGMKELVGQEDWVEAWRRLFSKGEVVGIKVNPVGIPHVISDASVLSELVAGLEAAGVRRKDIVVYDRYKNELLRSGIPRWLPDGVRTAYASREFDRIQQAIEGYDPEHFIDLPLALPGQRPETKDVRRSYAARFLTREVDKLINLCVLKDHQAAGVTLALKNLSHGLFNNVSRSHAYLRRNACGVFIPNAVALPILRKKVALHILDGIRGVYHGGPFVRRRFLFEHRTIYFATDPVALDRVGWALLDEQRVKMGLPKLAEATPDEFGRYSRRQPEHIERAGELGLGEWQLSRIDLRRVRLTS